MIRPGEPDIEGASERAHPRRLFRTELGQGRQPRLALAKAEDGPLIACQFGRSRAPHDGALGRGDVLGGREHLEARLDHPVRVIDPVARPRVEIPPRVGVACREPQQDQRQADADENVSLESQRTPDV
jgi:hypothetical protein